MQLQCQTPNALVVAPVSRCSTHLPFVLSMTQHQQHGSRVLHCLPCSSIFTCKPEQRRPQSFHLDTSFWFFSIALLKFIAWVVFSLLNASSVPSLRTCMALKILFYLRHHVVDTLASFLHQRASSVYSLPQRAIERVFQLRGREHGAILLLHPP